MAANWNFLEPSIAQAAVHERDAMVFQIGDHAKLHALLTGDEVDAGLSVFDTGEQTGEIAADVTQVLTIPTPSPAIESIHDPEAPTIELPRRRIVHAAGPASAMGWNDFVELNSPFKYYKVEGLGHAVTIDTELTPDPKLIEETLAGLRVITQRQIVLDHKELFMEWLDDQILHVPNAVAVLNQAEKYADILEDHDAKANLAKIDKFNSNSQFYGFRLYLDANPEVAALVDDDRLAPSVRVAMYKELWHKDEVRHASYYLYADHRFPNIEGLKPLSGRQALLSQEMSFVLAKRGQARTLREQALAAAAEAEATQAMRLEPVVEKPEVTAPVLAAETEPAREAVALANPQEFHAALERGERPVIRLRRVAKAVAMAPRKAPPTPEQKAQQTALENARTLFVLCLSDESAAYSETPASSMSLEELRLSLDTHKPIIDRKFAANLQAIENGTTAPDHKLALHLLGLKAKNPATYQNWLSAYDIIANGTSNG